MLPVGIPEVPAQKQLLHLLRQLDELRLHVLAHAGPDERGGRRQQGLLEIGRERQQAEAEAEGYKTEVCSCGLTFLAFHHWVRCEQDGCPLRGEKSMLDIMMGDDSE